MTDEPKKDTGKSLKNIFRVGTPECALFCGSMAMVLVLLFLVIGFWKTLLVAVITAAAMFVGGVKNKPACFKRIINGVFPARERELYRREDYKTDALPRQDAATSDTVEETEKTEVK